MGNKKEILESRRSFIKKAAYAAPTIVALGTISKPVVSAAASCSAANPCTNDTNNSGSTTTGSSNPATDDRGGFKPPF